MGSCFSSSDPPELKVKAKTKSRCCNNSRGCFGCCKVVKSDCCIIKVDDHDDHENENNQTVYIHEHACKCDSCIGKEPID